ncbi:MAG TPA: hypothetical protein VGF67_06750 [Ktedonobacteraceae bacterium]
MFTGIIILNQELAGLARVLRSGRGTPGWRLCSRGVPGVIQNGVNERPFCPPGATLQEDRTTGDGLPVAAARLRFPPEHCAAHCHPPVFLV